jgi:integrase
MTVSEHALFYELIDGELHRHGAAIRKTLVLLQSVLERAVEWGRVQTNPVRTVRKPPGKRRRVVRPLPPAAVEGLRARLLRDGRRRDATLLSVLAYAGPRPGEALALTWDDVRERVLLVERANAGGEIKATKTGQTRTVRLLAPLVTDLAEWRLASRATGRRGARFPGRTRRAMEGGHVSQLADPRVSAGRRRARLLAPAI